MNSSTADVYLGLGCNQGNRHDHLKNAYFALQKIPSFNIQQVSSMYQTKALGPISDPLLTQIHPDFFNIAVFAQTELSPQQLMTTILGIETNMGRQRQENTCFLPRTIDIDILLFNNIELSQKKLTIPHYDLLRRSFFVVPLLEINPSLCLPNGTPLNDVSNNCTDLKIKQVGSLI